MGLIAEPIIGKPRSRRLMQLDIQCDMFLKILQGLDGKRRIQTRGLPADVRCVGLKTDAAINTVTLLLESEEWIEVPESNYYPELNVTFVEYSGDAMPT